MSATHEEVCAKTTINFNASCYGDLYNYRFAFIGIVKRGCGLEVATIITTDQIENDGVDALLAAMDNTHDLIAFFSAEFARRWFYFESLENRERRLQLESQLMMDRQPPYGSTLTPFTGSGVMHDPRLVELRSQYCFDEYEARTLLCIHPRTLRLLRKYNRRKNEGVMVLIREHSLNSCLTVDNLYQFEKPKLRELQLRELRMLIGAGRDDGHWLDFEDACSLFSFKKDSGCVFFKK